MNSAQPEEQTAIFDRAHEFDQKQIAPHARKWAKTVAPTNTRAGLNGGPLNIAVAALGGIQMSLKTVLQDSEGHKACAQKIEQFQAFPFRPTGIEIKLCTAWDFKCQAAWRLEERTYVASKWCVQPSRKQRFRFPMPLRNCIAATAICWIAELKETHVTCGFTKSLKAQMELRIPLFRDRCSRSAG